MGISVLNFCLMILLSICFLHLKRMLKLLEEQNETMYRKVIKQRIQINKLQDELERYKKLHKIYSDYFYRRDTDAICNADD